MAGREHVVRRAGEQPPFQVFNVPSNFHVEFETENTLSSPFALEIL